MCGIAGVVGGPFELPAPELGRRMAQALHHRGPDGHGVRVLPEAAGVFAHTRLSVIDLSERAAQPFVSEDEQVVLVFNGEIYGYGALRDRLEAEGARFRSDSDTEVILHRYLLHGPAGLHALDGMFALALWDQREARLLLMRDRMGKKPLYWAEGPRGLAFASEAKALNVIPGFELSPNLEAAPEYLTYGYVSTPRSFFRGVSRLPPAHQLIRERDGAPRISRYWSLPSPHEVERGLDVTEAKRRVRDVVGRAVERRLVSDVPLGAFLSGGIDSSIVVAEMARRSSGKVRTFSVGFEDATFDERKYARQVAEQFGTDHTELVVSASPVDLMEKLLHHHDEPYGDSSALAVYEVAKATRDHVTVVLTGDGGDEVFAGYTRFLGGTLASLVPPLAARASGAVLRRFPEPRGYKHPIALLRRFVEHGDRSADEQLLAWNSFFAGPALGELLRPESVPKSFDPWSVYGPQLALLEEARAAGADRLDQILRHNLATYLLDDLLVKTDRMTMAVGLEARSPFLDTELVELAFRMPSSLKLRGRQLKWILREAYRSELSTDVLDRKKHGFGVPMSKWWSGALAPMVNDLLLAKTARVASLLEPTRIAELVRSHRAGERDHGQRIFLLLQLELWLRRVESGRS